MTLVRLNKAKDTRYPTYSPVFGDLMDTFFDNNFRHEGRGTYFPPVNIAENDHQFEIELAAPGRSKEEFSIHLDNGSLSISTEKKEEAHDETKKYTRNEYKYVSFSRSFNLPESADENQISADYNQGILHVKIGKKEGTKPVARKIEING